MARMGFSMQELPEALKTMKAMDLNVEGLFTHFADADNTDLSFTQKQVQKFQKAITLTKEAGFELKWIHANNSAGASAHKIPELNMMRLGIGLYGYPQTQDPSLKELQQVITVKSSLIAIRNLKKGESVSYGCTFIASKDMRIGTLPFGYYEGLPRSLSNKKTLPRKDLHESQHHRSQP